MMILCYEVPMREEICVLKAALNNILDSCDTAQNFIDRRNVIFEYTDKILELEDKYPEPQDLFPPELKGPYDLTEEAASFKEPELTDLEWYEAQKAKRKPEFELNVGDLTDEEWREYDIPGRRDTYTICNPQKLFTSPGGSTHRVLDAVGEVHCIPFPGNGTVLRWKPRDPKNPVSF